MLGGVGVVLGGRGRGRGRGHEQGHAWACGGVGVGGGHEEVVGGEGDYVVGVVATLYRLQEGREPRRPAQHLQAGGYKGYTVRIWQEVSEKLEENNPKELRVQLLKLLTYIDYHTNQEKNCLRDQV